THSAKDSFQGRGASPFESLRPRNPPEKREGWMKRGVCGIGSISIGERQSPRMDRGKSHFCLHLVAVFAIEIIRVAGGRYPPLRQSRRELFV
ncbi:MAG: hypothetical protein ACUVQH_15225, partial [Thermogutta sp.]